MIIDSSFIVKIICQMILLLKTDLEIQEYILKEKYMSELKKACPKGFLIKGSRSYKIDPLI